MILDKSYIMRIYISYIIKYHPISNQFLDSMLNSEMIVMLVLLERILFWRKPWPQGPIDNPNSIATMSVLSRSHRFHIVFHIVFHTVFLSSCFSLWFFHRFPSPLRSTEVSLGHPPPPRPMAVASSVQTGQTGHPRFQQIRSFKVSGQWGAMRCDGKKHGKWWKMMESWRFVLFRIVLLWAFPCSVLFFVDSLWHLKSRDLMGAPGENSGFASRRHWIRWKKRPFTDGAKRKVLKHWTFQALKVRSRCFSMIYGIISPAKTGVNKNPQGCPKWNSCNSHLSQSVLPLCNEKTQLKAEEKPLIFSFFSKKRYEVYWQVI